MSLYEAQELIRQTIRDWIRSLCRSGESALNSVVTAMKKSISSRRILGSPFVAGRRRRTMSAAGISLKWPFQDKGLVSVEFRTDTGSIAEQELKLAHLLVEALAAPFEPAKYKDTHREKPATKSIPFGETRRLELRWEALNHRSAAKPAEAFTSSSHPQTNKP